MALDFKTESNSANDYGIVGFVIYVAASNRITQKHKTIEE
jgi:hypothetical protein